MTHTIELSPRAERRLSDKARRAGLSLEKYLNQLFEREAEAMEPLEEKAAQMSEEEKQEIKARLTLCGYGMLSGNGHAVDDFLAERHAEAQREAEKDENRAHPQHEAAA